MYADSDNSTCSLFACNYHTYRSPRIPTILHTLNPPLLSLPPNHTSVFQVPHSRPLILQAVTVSCFGSIVNILLPRILVGVRAAGLPCRTVRSPSASLVWLVSIIRSFRRGNCLWMFARFLAGFRAACVPVESVLERTSRCIGISGGFCRSHSYLFVPCTYYSCRFDCNLYC